MKAIKEDSEKKEIQEDKFENKEMDVKQKILLKITKNVKGIDV